MKKILAWARGMYGAYREQLSYLFFGVVTTVVNYAVFWALRAVWREDRVLLANMIAFITAAAVAFVTNKLFVFQSRDWKLPGILREVVSFYAARVFSFLLEEAGLYVCAYVLFLDRYRFGPADGVLLAKLALNVLVIVLNYFFSKFLIFTQKRKSD